ncbi:MAG: acetate kinase [Clostridiales bacterium]|nr:acetate kinase [Clostridiales bacterium]
MMKVLVINAGSSSLKYQLINMDDESVMAKGVVERIGIEGSNLVHKIGDRKIEIKKPLKDHVEAIQLVLAALVDPDHGAVKSMDEIGAVGHRVVHGGEAFAGSVMITDEVMQALRDNIELAPLHNPANIMGIEACKAVMPNVPMAGVFDTAFHQTMPKKSFLYALPYEVYEKYKIRRYGFHGTSHKFVSESAAQFLGKELKDLKIITCHLGNGSSITAVDHGKVLDTSMGLTPLQGVPMGTRSGDIDPAILEVLMNKENMDITQMNTYLNKKCGVFGISGISSDFRDLTAASREGNERAELALQVFCYQVKKYIGAYAAAMNGADVIVFTAGVGENTPHIRKRIMSNMEYMGFELDDERNENGKDSFVFSKDGSKVIGLVIPTNEELVIARDTKTLCENA